MKFNFCPTCGEYLNLSYETGESDRTCKLGHSLQIPKTIILATAILSDHSNILLERKFLFNKEFWSLPHTEVHPNELPEHTLSRNIQTSLLQNVSVESLILAQGDEHMFHLFYELKLMNAKNKVGERAPNPYQWFTWKDIPWGKIAYHHHHEMLLQWLTLKNDKSSGKPNFKSISQYRGIKIL